MQATKGEKIMDKKNLKKVDEIYDMLSDIHDLAAKASSLAAEVFGDFSYPSDYIGDMMCISDDCVGYVESAVKEIDTKEGLQDPRKYRVSG
jgi:hypothetical protein